MSISGETQVSTKHASRYLVEICRQFDERAKAKPELGVRVEWNEAHGVVDFGWGRCAMSAAPGALTLRAESGDPEGLKQIQELVRRHLESQGEAEGLTVDWPLNGADGHAERRDAMRSFHHRMRHEPG
jgi:hypothetical protein